MSIFIKKHLLKIIGILTGGIAGFAYYYFVGCATGACPLKSNPYLMTTYGALLGYLVFDMFKTKKDEAN
jgi:hypothetical protein